MIENYYNKNTANYIESTISLDMSEFYNRFLNHIPAKGSILDLGCGSGRDSKAFLELGYEVVALDGSVEMVRHASAYTGLPVMHKKFDELDLEQKLDGIFACASLLHVESRKLPALFSKLNATLKPGGVLYMSFKHGTFEGERNGRHFTDLTEQSLGALLTLAPLTILGTWKTSDIRSGRESELWLNVLVLADGEL